MLGMARNTQGGMVATNAEGYLIDPSDWTEDFAQEVAERRHRLDGRTLEGDPLHAQMAGRARRGARCAPRHEVPGRRQRGWSGARLRALPVWLCETGVQDRRHEEATRVE